MKYRSNSKYREKALALMLALAMIFTLFPGLGGSVLATGAAVVEAGGAAAAPAFDTDLNTDPVAYTIGDTATALTVAANASDGGTVSYQWYSNTENSTEGGTEISETTASCIPDTNSPGTTYYYVIATNTLDGSTATATSSVAAVTVTEALDLTRIFEDADGDPLTYQVSIDGTPAVDAASGYSYTPTEAGVYTLVFTASDGTAESVPYTVTLTCFDEEEMAVSFPQDDVTLQYVGAAAGQPLYIVSVPKDLEALQVGLKFLPDFQSYWHPPQDMLNESSMQYNVLETGESSALISVQLTDSYNYTTLSGGMYSHIVTENVDKDDFAWDNIAKYYLVAFYDNDWNSVCWTLVYKEGSEGLLNLTKQFGLTYTNATLAEAGAVLSGTDISDGGTISSTQIYRHRISNYYKADANGVQSRPLEKIVINGVDVTIPAAGESKTIEDIPGIFDGTVTISGYASGQLYLAFSRILPSENVNIEYVFEESGQPNYAATAAVAEGQRDLGMAAAAFVENMVEGGSVWRFTATPTLGYGFGYWAYRAAGSEDEYTIDEASYGQASYTVTISEDREYIANFTASQLSLGGSILGGNHSPSMEYPKLPGGFSDEIPAMSDEYIQPSEVFVGELVGFGIEYTLSGSVAAGTPISFKLYAEDNTAGEPLAEAVGTIRSGGTAGTPIPAGTYKIFLRINAMPDVSKLTVAAQLGDNGPVTKTYPVSLKTPTEDDYITCAITVSDCLEPTLVRVLKGVPAIEVLTAALEKEYPSDSLDTPGTWYIDMQGGFINAIGVDPSRRWSGFVALESADRPGSIYWGTGTYGVNGFFCDLGTVSWISHDGEIVGWGGTTRPMRILEDDGHGGKIAVDYDHRRTLRVRQGGPTWAIAVLRDHYTDEELLAMGIGSEDGGFADSKTVEELKEMFPHIADNLDWYLADDLKAGLDPFKAAVDAIGEVTLESGDAIAAARTAYNTRPDIFPGSTGYYPFLLRTYEPYKTAYQTLLAAEKRYAELTGQGEEAIDPAEALDGVLSYIQSTVTNPTVDSVSGEWAVLALARGGEVDKDSDWARTYLDNLDAALAAGDTITAATDYERVTLALTALGIDASDYQGRDLTEAYATYNEDMSLSAKIFAILALNSKPYESEATGDYVDGLLAAALEGGGWAISGSSADVDMSAMAIQALAPYYTNPNVKTNLDEALDVLKEKQDPASGGFSGWGGGNVSTCSTAQAVTALCALGMDPTGAQWITAEGKNPLTGLLTYYDQDNGCFGESSAGANQMATEQAAYALVAYDRFVSEDHSLYDMSDAFGVSSDTRVKTVAVKGTTATAGEGSSFTAVLPYGSDPAAVTPAEVIITTMNSKASSSVPVTADNGATWSFTVTAEDGGMANYTVQISVSQDPAAGNQADVAAVKAAIQSLPWAVPMAAANTEPGIKTWVEAQLSTLNLNGVTVTVAMDSFSAASGTTAGSFSFTADLSKGEGETLVTDSLQLSGVITVPSSAIGQVHVIVENTVWPVSAGAVWEGLLADAWVDIDEESTMMTAVVAALDSVQATQTGAEGGYISSINGLNQLAAGSGSGWMGTLNDWFTHTGFDGFTVAAGALEDDDQIRVMYTTNLGGDLGGSWDNNDKTVKAMAFSTGTLSPAFDKDTHAYILTVPEGTEGVIVTPTASNKNFQVRSYLGTQDTGTEYRRTATIPVSDGSIINVVCGDPSWPSMNGAPGVPAETYTITVETEAEETTGYTVGLSSADTDRNPGDTVTMNLNVDGSEGIDSYAALQTTVGYDKSRVSYSGSSLGSGFTVTDNPSAGKLVITRVGASTPTGNQGSLSFRVRHDIPAGSNEAVFSVMSALVGASGDPSDPEAAATGSDIDVNVHNLTVSFTAGANVSMDTATAYTKYGVPGLYTDNFYTTLFTEPVATADSGYILDSPLWNDGSGHVDYESIAATAFTANAVYTATATQDINVSITLPEQVTIISGVEDGKASYGTDVVFSVTPDPGKEIVSVAYTVGSGSPVTLSDTEGVYTIPGDALTADVIVTVAQKLSGTVSFIGFDDYKGAPTGFKVLKFTGSAPEGYKYQYNDTDMYYSEKYQLFVCFVAADVNEGTALAGISCVEGTAPEINYDGNVNQSGAGLVNIIDAQLVYDLYTGVYLTDPAFANVSRLMRLAADVNGDGSTDTTDVQIIVSLVQNQEV